MIAQQKPAMRGKGRKLPPGITKRESEATGQISYQVRLRRVGLPTIARTFDSLLEAEAWKAESETKRNRGERVATRADRRATIVDAIDEYVAKNKTLNDKEKQRLTFLRLEFAEVAMMGLTAPRLEAWRDQMLATIIPPPASKKKAHPLYDGGRVRTYSESSVRKFFYTLKKVLEWYAAFYKQPFDNPFQQVSAPSEDNWRSRRLEGNEENRIMAACEKMHANRDELKRVIAFALETGMRAGEILKLEWHEVDHAKRRIIIPAHKCKTRREREVPITTPCRELLHAHEKATRKQGETRVFWQWPSSNTLGHRFKVVAKNAQLRDFRFHDFRHEATSRMYERTKLTDVQISSITGHTDLRTLKRYANLRGAQLADMMW